MASERQYNLLFASEDWKPTYDSTPAANALVVTLTPVQANGRIQLGLVCLSGETGTGGAPTITITSSLVPLWSGAYTFGSGYTKDFGNPLSAFEGKSLVITAAATNLTGGVLTVCYRELPIQ